MQVCMDNLDDLLLDDVLLAVVEVMEVTEQQDAENNE